MSSRGSKLGPIYFVPAVSNWLSPCHCKHPFSGSAITFKDTLQKEINRRKKKATIFLMSFPRKASSRHLWYCLGKSELRRATTNCKPHHMQLEGTFLAQLSRKASPQLSRRLCKAAVSAGGTHSTRCPRRYLGSRAEPAPH